MKKRFLCFMLGLAFLTNIVTVSYAMDTRDENRFLNENSYKSNELYNTLVDVGFSDEEIIELYQREADKTGISFNLPENLKEKLNVTKVITNNTNPQMMLLRSYDGEIRHRTISINFDKIARYCGWSGHGSSALFIINEVTKSQFTKALITSSGLGWAVAIVDVAGIIFSSLAKDHTGVDLYLTERYQYDEYEGFGKWYLVDADYKFWR
ncbi:hypothetical protein [Peptoniphilus rhinitidis]|uniref:hypothetical protein n=1 Tax=Peptoniphilus rhinitidis TaxID=1175452 RepID=UPI0023541433|nr:hypothetical protein [Peptoniphilus rhinitidis]